MLSGNLNKANILYEKIDDTFSKCKKTAGLAGYIVKNHYYDTLLDLYKYCNENMSKDKWSQGNNWEPYALDQQWAKLQKKDNWYGFTNDLLKQRASSGTVVTSCKATLIINIYFFDKNCWIIKYVFNAKHNGHKCGVFNRLTVSPLYLIRNYAKEMLKFVYLLVFLF